jgi:hypothetical protein
MLKKLMKHELRATARGMLPLYLLVLVVTLGTRLFAHLLDFSSSGQANGLILLFLDLFSIAFVVCLIGIFVATLVLMITRFQKNLLGDEGYGMFTLPVTPHQLVWSKLLVSALWFLGAVLVDVLAIAILSGLSLPDLDLWALFSDLDAEVFAHGLAATLEFILLVVLGLFALCLSFYAPMAIGHSFGRHKTLLSVVFYFVIQIIYQITAGTFLFSSSLVDLTTADLSAAASVHATLWLAIAIVLVYGGVLYALTLGMLTKRLNLA